MKCIMKMVQVSLLLCNVVALHGYQAYVPLRTAILQPHTHKAQAGSTTWITSVEQFKSLVMAPTALPAVVCVVHSKGASVHDMAQVMSDAHRQLEGKVAAYCVDAAHPEMQIFVNQLQNKLGLTTLPLPAFVFFKQREIVLPVQAGIISAPALTNMTKLRFGLQQADAPKKLAEHARVPRSKRTSAPAA